MENSIGRYIRRFFSGTLLSRVSGMVRDLTMASAFGDHPSVAAFFVAFRLSNLFRRLFGEGPLQTAFIPHFEGLRVENPAKASFFFRNLAILITIVLLSITLVVEGGIVGLFTYFDLSESSKEVIALTGWLFPGIVFICLYGLNISVLNCHDSFFIPSFAPFVCNVVWIAAAFSLRTEDPTTAMLSLSKWIVIGFFGQWLLTLPQTLKHVAGAWKDWFAVKISPEIIKLIKSFGLGAIGVGAVQINALADAIFARYADIRGPSYLWYSIRLEQLALAIFGIACISTIVPRFSRAVKAGTVEKAQELFSLSYKRIMIIMIPCTFAIIALGLASVNLLYGRGHFSDNAVVKTTVCLWAYGLSLLPTTLVMLFSAVFYAHDNFRIPTIISVISVVINLILNYFFVFTLHLGVISIALSTSFSAWANCMILHMLVLQQGWKFDFTFSRIAKIIFASCIAMITAFSADYLLFDSNSFRFLYDTAYQFPNEISDQIWWFATQAVSFAVGFLAYTIVFKNADILDTCRDTLFARKARPAVDIGTLES